MCIFSQPVKTVSGTRIFARLQDRRQYLAYEMRLAAAQDLAMILPLPTRARDEGQVKFIDLSGYAKFFDDMEKCFPMPLSRGFGLGAQAASLSAPLVVHQVGAFEASFVPALADFTRLDARFRLADDIWRQFPAYADYGFAVFQLRAGDARVHPMALGFETRDPSTLYFPTSHVHDGAAHPTAHFDHSLYAQGAAGTDWKQGEVLPRNVMDFGNFLIADRTRGLVQRDAPVLRRTLRGEYPNQDIRLSV